MPPPPPPLSSPAIPSLCQKGVRKRLSRAFVADYVCNNTFAGADDVARPGEMAARLGVSAQALRNHGSRVNGSVHLETGELPPIRSTSEASVGAWTSRKMDRPRARKTRAARSLSGDYRLRHGLREAPSLLTATSDPISARSRCTRCVRAKKVIERHRRRRRAAAALARSDRKTILQY